MVNRHLDPRPSYLIHSLVAYVPLIQNLVRRQVASRYKSSILGPLWYVVTPILMLGVYTIVFSKIFGMRWGQNESHPLDFALNLYAGLIVFYCFSDIMTTASSLVTGSPSLVKKTVFPVHLLAIVAVIVTALNFLINLVILCCFALYVRGSVPYLALLTPILLLPLFCFLIGFGWLFSSAGVYVRDLSPAVGFLTNITVFLTPIFYPLSIVPENLRNWVLLNPLTVAVEISRNAILLNKLPSIGQYFIWLSASVVFALICFFLFQRMRRGFADVL